MKNILKVKKEKFMEEAIRRIKPSNILLDIGCGIRPHEYAHHNTYIACEPFSEYVEVLKKDRKECSQTLFLDTTFLILNEDWRRYLDKYEDYAVDTVYLIDVIEHLTKEEGEELLARTEKIAKKQIIIFTPLEYIEQKSLPGNKDAWGYNGTDWQEHKSVWTPDDFCGDEWSFVVCDDYHQFNNVGEKLEKPAGAFWAIKNVESQIDKVYVTEQKDIAAFYLQLTKESTEKKKIMLDRLSAQENSIAELSNIVEKQLSELESIKGSRGYRLVVKYRTWREKVKGIFK